MTTRRRLIFMGGYTVSLSLCLLLAISCGKKEEATTTSGGPPSSSGMGRPPGGRMGGPGGGGAPVAATASGTEIYQAKCGCHGDQGKGKNAPALASAAAQSEDALTAIIKNGKGKMPAFASQLSDDQIKKVVATIKTFK